MSGGNAARIALAMALAVLCPVPVPAEEPAGQSTSLRTVEGTVSNVTTQPGEAGLDVVTLTLETRGPDQEQLDVLLAPQQVLDEISFDLESGDRLRVRVFVDDQGPLKVQKALNLTRGTMVRFRSLRQVPLWSTAGDWEGGVCRRQGGHGGGHGGRGGGPKR